MKVALFLAARGAWTDTISNPMLRTLALAALFYMAGSRGAFADVTEAMKSSDTISKCVRPSPTALFMFGPECQEVIVRGGQKSEMKYNKTGLRDKDYPPIVRPGWKRVLFLGSSGMAGPGLASEDTPPKQLEKLLRRTFKKLELINAGVEAYATQQVAARTPDWVKAYNPTHVIFFFDVGQSANADPGLSVFAEWGPDETVAMSYKIFPFFERLAKIKKWDMNTWPVQRRLRTMEEMGYRARLTIGCRLRNWNDQAFRQCILHPTLRALRSIMSSVEKSGAKLLLLPMANSFSNDIKISPGQDLEAAQFFDRLTPRVQFFPQEVLQAFSRNGIPHQPVSVRMGPGHTLPGDYHPNELGAKVIAETLEPYVVEFLNK